MNKLLDDITNDRGVRIAAIAVLAVLALFLLAKTWDEVFGRDTDYAYSTITVEGIGTAVAIPDTATVTFSVLESSADVATAQNAANDKIARATEALEDLDIEEADVKTLGYGVTPQYENPQYRPYEGFGTQNPPRIVSYEVSQTMEVRIRDAAKVGDVLTALGAIGVQSVSGPQFSVGDEEEVKDEARAEAVADAREKARTLARDLGVRLGDVTSFAEIGDYYGAGYEAAPQMSDIRVTAVAPTLPVGQDETEVRVSVTYEIK